ncbi:uncharacterized protein LOC131858429 [Cryptomeria japonica]|uniref:uncharacterized protein LOC131858429 n=1 Tax=Cryptomeria japonica TaxID=3369 RepID=UPI0027DA7E1C|nr:uncharacterized protein LOC131858429 [Cryptomeria japonica]
MIDTLKKKYGGETSDATASTGTSEQTGAKSSKDGEQTEKKKKMSKSKPKGVASSKPATYMKEKDSNTPTSSQDYNQASVVVEACAQHFKIRNRTRRVAIEDIKGVHDEGVAMWKTILSQQKEVEEEIEKQLKEGQDVVAQEKGKRIDNDTTDEFDVFTVEDIIAKGTNQTKHLGEDEVIIEEIPYEERPQRNPVTINTPTTNPTNNELHLPKKGAEEETPKVIDSSIPFVDEAEKKEKKIERKEIETTETSPKETKELELDKKKEDSLSGQPKGSKKIVMDTPPMKQKLELEKESGNKKAKLTISASSKVEAEEEKEEKEEEEEEDSIIDTKKMTPK